MTLKTVSAGGTCIGLDHDKVLDHLTSPGQGTRCTDLSPSSRRFRALRTEINPRRSSMTGTGQLRIIAQLAIYHGATASKYLVGATPQDGERLEPGVFP